MAKKEKRIFQTPAIVDGISPLKDGGMSVRLHTNELSNEQKVVLMEFYQKFGFLLFAEDMIQQKFIPENDTDIEGRKVKTPSQRLRGVIFLRWKGGDQSMDTDRFYEAEIEKLIDYEKKKLDEETL